MSSALKLSVLMCCISVAGCVGLMGLDTSGAECGPANGVAASTAPSTGLCATGLPVNVAGDGPWTWNCASAAPSALASCSAPSTVSTTDPVNGQCGSASGTRVSTAPNANLCTAGTASTVTGTGPWVWSCAGSNDGENVSCQASVSGPDGSKLPPAGNPDGSCKSTTVVAQATAVDTSHPTSVVGNGTAASCTFTALSGAVTKGGIITFNCGDGLVTIPITRTLTPPATNHYANQGPIHIVIDGGSKITLDGQNATRILLWNHAGNFRVNDDTLTLQHIRLINGKATPTEAIPACPGTGNSKCSQGFNDGVGGAISITDGSLRIIDATFSNNQGALRGPDTGGGAIYALASLGGVFIANSSFTNNKASNAGAIGMLWSGGAIYNSLFTGNAAVGDGANNDDPSQCSCMNNGQNEIGSGGNGGAIYKDGADGASLTLCGDQIKDNTSNEFGAAVFLTADGGGSKLVVYDSLITSNSSPVDQYWHWCTDISTDNPHQSGSSSGSPAPVDSSFCASSTSCTATCDS